MVVMMGQWIPARVQRFGEALTEQKGYHRRQPSLPSGKEEFEEEGIECPTFLRSLRFLGEFHSYVQHQAQLRRSQLQRLGLKHLTTLRRRPQLARGGTTQFR